MTEGYTDLSTAELDDIITCVASMFIRANYSMSFKYTDLAKFQNYIGFESGVWCVYPNYNGLDLLLEQEEAESIFGCMEGSDEDPNGFFTDTYLDVAEMNRTAALNTSRCLTKEEVNEET